LPNTVHIPHALPVTETEHAKDLKPRARLWRNAEDRLLQDVKELVVGPFERARGLKHPCRELGSVHGADQANATLSRPGSISAP
jgi:hypothetical protein